jgi:hypothetical protein
MSEAMSSVEIEDVLSSIRRLVSEDLRPGIKPATAKKPDEKLLLTPAFRVVPVAAPTVPMFAEPVVAPPSPAPLPRLHLGAAMPSEKSFATLERAVEEQDTEWESEVGDPAPLVAAMEWSEAGWTPVLDASTPTPAAVEEPQPTHSWAQDDPEPSEALGIEDLQDRPIAEPDSYWADQAEAEAVAELRAEEADTISNGAVEMTFDEDVLRDLVRDLIREELQGGLGERITRNVRKLVRAEIARALATQDLD